MARSEKTETINVRLESSLKNQAERIAAIEQTTVTAMVRTMIKDMINDRKFDEVFRKLEQEREPKPRPARRTPTKRSRKAGS